MDQFFKARAADRRFPGGRVDVQQTAVSSWYRAPKRARYTTTVYKASMATEGSYTATEPKKKKKKKKKEQRDHDSGGNASTSDGSDSSPCWSDYERTPGTEEGTKGSCRPKGSKKKKKKKSDE